jgi:hypothetical protein
MGLELTLSSLPLKIGVKKVAENLQVEVINLQYDDILIFLDC